MHVSLSVILAAGLLQTGSGELIEELDAAPPRTGFIMLAESPARLLGDSAAQNLDAILPADEPVQWHVYVPRAYSAGKPPGVLVFVSSIDWGGIPEDWIPLMDEYNLIWISPGSAGRSVPAQQRVMKAVLAPHAISREFQVDTQRIFVGGFSDGGKIAGLVQAADPAVFMGSLFVCGAIAWGERHAHPPLCLRQGLFRPERARGQGRAHCLPGRRHGEFETHHGADPATAPAATQRHRRGDSLSG